MLLNAADSEAEMRLESVSPGETLSLLRARHRLTPFLFQDEVCCSSLRNSQRASVVEARKKDNKQARSSSREAELQSEAHGRMKPA